MNKQGLEEIRLRHTSTEQVILARRSCRSYKREQVPEFMVRRILEAGRFAPSAGNYQPWKFVVLRDRQMIDELTDCVVRRCRLLMSLLDYRRPGKRWLRPLTSLFVNLRPNDLHPVPFDAMDLIGKRELALYHGASTVILIFEDVRGVSCPMLDCGIAGQNMALAAHSMGLGTCWVGFSKLALKYGKKWKKRLGIGYPYKFASSLAVGFPKGNPDGQVTRQTHVIDWHEDGVMRQLDMEGAQQ